MGSSQSPPVPRDATTPPSQAQHIQVVSRETRTRHILMCDINCIPVVWTSHSPAGFSLLQLFYYEAFVVIGLLCIVDVRLMAKETIRHCYGEKKCHRRLRWRKASTTALQFIEDLHVEKKSSSFFSVFLLKACSHRNSNYMSSYFCIYCFCPGSRNALFLFPHTWTLPSF